MQESKRTQPLRLSLDQAYVPCSTKEKDASRILPEYTCAVDHVPEKSQATSTRSTVPFSDPHQDGVTGLVFAARFPEMLPDALQKLENALHVSVGGAREKAQRYGDLAAAYFQSAHQHDTPFDLVRALETIEQAVRLDPDDERIAFNRAKILHSLNLRHEARREWQRWLDFNPASSWTQEAREALEDLDLQLDPNRPTTHWDEEAVAAAIDAGDAEALETWISNGTNYARGQVHQWLFAWGQAVVEQDESTAGDSLRRAGVLARELFDRTGDRWALDAVTVTEEAVGPQRRSLVQGYASYADALQKIKDADLEDVPYLIQEAHDRFIEVGHPLRLESRKYLDLFAFSMNADARDLAAQRRAFDELRQQTDPSYHWLLAELNLQEVLTHTQDFQPSKAKVLLEPAWQVADELNDEQLRMRARLYGAEVYEALGANPQAWQARYESLQLIDRYSAGSVHEILAESAYSLQSRGMFHAARILLDEALTHFPTSDDDRFRALPLLRRAQLLAHLGSPESAADDLAAGQVSMNAVPSGLKTRYRAEEALARAAIEKQRDPQAALTSLTEVVESFEGSNRLLQLPALVARAEVQAQLGDPEAAVQDLENSLETYDELRSDAEMGPRLRAAAFEQSRTAFESLILRHLEQGDPRAALEVSEQLRARVLLDLSVSRTQGLDPRTTRAEPLTYAQIEERLPENLTVFSTLVLPDRLLVWRLGRGEEPSVRQVTEPWRQGDTFTTALRLAVEAQHPSSGRTEAEVAEAARYVASALGLTAPMENELPPEEAPLLFVPDHSLHLQPFAALPLADGRFLLERNPVAVTPSLSMLLQSERASERRGATVNGSIAAADSVSTLVVGNPQMAQRLEAADREARSIAALYPDSTLLTDEEATREAVLAALQQSPKVVHIATHGFTNRLRPDWASLQLAPVSDGAGVSGQDDGKLYARDLYSLQLPTTELVVLAACDTAVGDYSTREGPSSLARPFLAAGVPAVVATLWKVDDEVTERVMVRFHEELRRGLGVMEALRVAQVEEMRSGGGAGGEWAGFAVLNI